MSQTHPLDKPLITGAVIVMALSAATLAVSGYPPGWEYGRLNCNARSTPQVTTNAGCKTCCDNGEAAQIPLPPASWLIDCYRYCDTNPWI